MVRQGLQHKGETMLPHRRQFIRGQWIPQAAGTMAHGAASEIASVLVQVRPQRLDAVQAAVAEIPGAQIAQRDERGKLVIVLDSSQGESIGDSLTKMSLMPDVISASLVFHGLDTG
jgi:periplasmic nitrate reductase NapD